MNDPKQKHVQLDQLYLQKTVSSKSLPLQIPKNTLIKPPPLSLSNQKNIRHIKNTKKKKGQLVVIYLHGCF